MEYTTIGQRIATERKKLGISQEQLGEKTGVSRQAISKWEADAAIPEIDKLIAMSRLFGVSVGWLLGVEEISAAQPDELSETQLKTVEEIVKRYQQKSANNRLFIALAGIIGIAAICITSFFARPPATNYSGQIDAIHQENLNIQAQLDIINGQLESINAGLASYRMTLVDVSTEYAELFIPVELQIYLGTVTVPTDADAELAFALLAFEAVPQNREESEQVFLEVYYNSRIVSQIPLEWVDGVYQGTFSLPLEDGYEYCFIRQRDGITHRHSLSIAGFHNLTESTQHSS